MFCLKGQNTDINPRIENIGPVNCKSGLVHFTRGPLNYSSTDIVSVHQYLACIGGSIKCTGASVHLCTCNFYRSTMILALLSYLPELGTAYFYYSSTCIKQPAEG